MKRISSALLAFLLSVGAPLSAECACGHATLSSTAATIVAAGDISPAGRHGLCIYNTSAGTTTPTLSFSIANTGLPLWQKSVAYAQGTLIQDSNGNTQRASTGGTSGLTAPSWATSSGSTTTDNTVTWTLMQVGVAAVAADWLLMPTGANNGVENYECFYQQGNALVPGGAVSGISSGGATVAYCSW